MEHGPLRILIVQHESDAGPGLLGERLHETGAAVTLAGPQGLNGAEPIPSSAAGHDGVVVLGGSPGPLDDELAPWLPRVRALIASALSDGTPLLGVCLGAQLVAHVAGGEVAPVSAGAEIGVLPLWLTDDAFGDPLVSGLDGPLQAVQWHELEITELTPGVRRLCRGDRCINQAFRIGRTAWGIQFHLEALPGIVEGWTRSGADDLAAAGVDPGEFVADARAAEIGLRSLWEPVCDNWVSVCIENRENRRNP